jgi:hypothetical protein
MAVPRVPHSQAVLSHVAARLKRRRVDSPRPCGILGWDPSQGSYGRCGIRDALERADTVRAHTLHLESTAAWQSHNTAGRLAHPCEERKAHGAHEHAHVNSHHDTDRVQKGPRAVSRRGRVPCVVSFAFRVSRSVCSFVGDGA